MAKCLEPDYEERGVFANLGGREQKGAGRKDQVGQGQPEEGRLRRRKWVF